MSFERHSLPPAHRRDFATTNWSLVLAAGERNSPDFEQALATLCERYWYPLYAHVRRRGIDADLAQDLTQEFFARLMEKEYLQVADRNRGRFRSFLLSTLDHFLANHWRRQRAQKRGGRQPTVPIDFALGEGRYQNEPADLATPEALYERHWALTLLAQALAALEEEYTAAGKADRFEQLKPFLAGDAEQAPYERVAASAGMTVAAVKMAVHRLRRRCGELLRREIAQTAADPAFAERFAREARALARLNHPNIVSVFDSGQADGLYYLAMEYVDGTNLRELMRAGSLKPSEALAIVPQICDALQFAHDEGIVHRDIKPENVLLDQKGRIKIADFGLAKLLRQAPADHNLTGESQVMGTPHYMAPEQVERPLDVDHRADIYSLGVVFYEMLTGELPLGRFEPPSHKVSVSVQLDEVVLRALAKEPDRRYQHASDVRTDVEAIDAAGRGPPARSLPLATSPQVFLPWVDWPGESLPSEEERSAWSPSAAVLSAH
ncbi:MAG TPA: protein kinase [Pirellulales bacterium]|nr:protein kinase [Pirellulales bacterium]